MNKSMENLSVIGDDSLTNSKTLAQILSLLAINISSTALTPGEQSQFLDALERQMRNPLYEEALLTNIIASHIEKFLPPILLLLGIFGNILSICILLNKTMVKQTTNIFFAVLAMADCVVLLVGLLRRWAGDISGVDIQRETSWLCKIVTILTYTSSHFSVWLIVAVTVMRYIAVSVPHQASRLCNHKTAKRVIVALAVTALAVNLHFIWTVELKKYNHGLNVIQNCEAEEGFEDFVHNIWPWIDASVFALAPFLLLFVFNTLIIIHTLRATVWRRQNQREKASIQRQMSRNNIKLTLTLLTISFSFLVTTFPMATVMVSQNYWRNKIDESSNTMELLSRRRLVRTISEILMYMNHSLNFFLYCAVGENFRNQMRQAFCRRTGINTSRTSDHSSHLYCSRDNGSYAHSQKSRERASSTWL